jgi:hypothetical protein
MWRRAVGGSPGERAVVRPHAGVARSTQDCCQGVRQRAGLASSERQPVPVQVVDQRPTAPQSTATAVPCAEATSDRRTPPATLLLDALSSFHSSAALC